MKPRLSASSQYRQCGIALVVTLWVLVILVIMATGFTATTRTETRLTSQALHSTQARGLAKSGIWLAVQDILLTETERKWATDNTPVEIPFHYGLIEISIQDEAGKIDIFTAHPDLLYGLLISVNTDEQKSREITDAIQDWRDRDSQVREFGAEDPDYLRAGYPHDAKDGPFNSIEELRQVMGMTEEIYQKIRPALTIYSHLPGVNPDVAPRNVLRAVPEMDKEIIDLYLARRSTPTQDIIQVTQDINSHLFNRTNGVSFMITSTGIVNGTQTVIEAVISLRKSFELPYTILAWREI